MLKKVDSLSILFPVYKDTKTVEILIKKSVLLCEELSLDYEIIIEDATDQIEDFVQKANLENPIQ